MVCLILRFLFYLVMCFNDAFNFLIMMCFYFIMMMCLILKLYSLPP
ncbi:hypothetical protein N198_04655 [Helicobacter pylori UM037]|uniref:Uncharacterized protein n=1 Tax=Helicobacter pylori UM037 TaxID=1321939 RepID=A0AB33Z8E4_HELPX|nr:hypothetical protein N198_07955 [Helicobacter pylori UM037]EQK94812.1 hypothetical protein N198_06500 [Helicobacter pylori UM037]EQK95009.1 hypothetical protein N198_05450 [Helicobacter pylori UM037]EQK95213.1 hypothetical protein N198_04655 [Helicobacter pylori UM037]